MATAMIETLIHAINHSPLADTVGNFMADHAPKWLQHLNGGWAKQLADANAPKQFLNLVANRHNFNLVHQTTNAFNIVEGTTAGTLFAGLGLDGLTRVFSGHSLPQQTKNLWHSRPVVQALPKFKPR